MPLSFLCLMDDADAMNVRQWLARARAVHRQLRGQLPSEEDAYQETLARIFANGGHLCLAVEDSAVRGLALWRVLENTQEGRRLVVDDLVVDAAHRSQGVGKALIDWLENRARSLSCAALALDSGVQRSDAHRFYFREGFIISAFGFRKKRT
ncbi:MAG: GNAT family N-acetyltransferase [Zoogloeaceae bacterium]|nr:GNAT family N-acetyltransferase [Zoogloeaceae bacterium]